MPLDVLAIVKSYQHLALSTRYNYSSNLRSMLRRLAETYGAPQGLWREVPKQDVPAPRNRVISHAESEAILAQASPALRLYVLLCGDLALRSGTAVKVSPAHYNPESRTVTITTKKQSGLTLPVTGEIEAILNSCQRCPPDMPFVTYLSVKKGRHRASFYQGFKLILARAGLDHRITPHDLRRTAAIKMLNASGDIRNVQMLLGHKHLSNTAWYLDHGTQKLSHQLLEQVKQGRVN